MSFHGCMGAVLAAIFLLFPVMDAAAQNPFAPPSARPSEAAPVEKASEPGLFARTQQWMFDIQRTMVRDIGNYMRDMKEGSERNALWIGLALAFAYGAVHAIGPGHGKMVVASYFVGQEARIGRGLLMGVQIAVTHVISAIILVWLVDFSFRQFMGGPPAESKGIRLVSYGLIIGIGLYMLFRAIGKARGGNLGHGHGRGHDHSGHRQGALALVAGLVPCTGAILVMLFALANDIVMLGVLLVVAISAGMALTMSAIGAASVLFRRAVIGATQHNLTAQSRVAVVLEHLGAVLILAIGASFFTATLGL